MNKNELPLIINTKTGGVFHQIGVAKGVKCGFRVWLQSPSKSASSALIIGFRVRLEPEHPMPEGEVFKLMCVKLFPTAKWTGLSLNHVSMAGEIMVRVPFWEKDKALEAMNKNDVGGRVADYLNKALPGFDFDREEFADYFLDVLNTDYSGAVDTTDCDGLVLFAPCEGENYILKDGFEVTPVVTTPPIKDIAQPPKVELVKKETYKGPSLGTGSLSITNKEGKTTTVHGDFVEHSKEHYKAAEKEAADYVASHTEGVAAQLKAAGMPEEHIATYKKVFGLKKVKPSPGNQVEHALGGVIFETVKASTPNDTGPANGSLEPDASPSLSPDGEN